MRPEAVRRFLRQRKAGLGVLYRIGKKTPVHSNVPCVSRLPPVSFNRYMYRVPASKSFLYQAHEAPRGANCASLVSSCRPPARGLRADECGYARYESSTPAGGALDRRCSGQQRCSPRGTAMFGEADCEGRWGRP